MQEREGGGRGGKRGVERRGREGREGVQGWRERGSRGAGGKEGGRQGCGGRHPLSEAREVTSDAVVTWAAGVEVTLVDANHCPGAVIFLFRLQDGRRYVHTGDMRFSPAMLANLHLQRFQGADALYLDTTYCNVRHTFPPQVHSVGPPAPFGTWFLAIVHGA